MSEYLEEQVQALKALVNKWDDFAADAFSYGLGDGQSGSQQDRRAYEQGRRELRQELFAVLAPPKTSTKYQLKPALFDAVCYTGANYDELRAFVGVALHPIHGCPVLRRPSGDALIQPGEFVVRTPYGDYEICNPEVFKATYMPVYDPET